MDKLEYDPNKGDRLQARIADLKERIMRCPWHAGLHLSPSELETLAILLGLNRGED